MEVKLAQMSPRVEMKLMVGAELVKTKAISNMSEMIFGDFDGHPASPSVDLSLKEELVLWIRFESVPAQ